MLVNGGRNMGKTLTCPFCNNKDTLKVVYCYIEYKRKNNDLSNLVKDGTIYNIEKKNKI